MPAGKYNVIVVYPDGMHKSIGNFEVRAGIPQNLDFILIRYDVLYPDAGN
jgi:hypothetical protein